MRQSPETAFGMVGFDTLAVVLFFTVCVFSNGCLRQPRKVALTKQLTHTDTLAQPRININTATREELEQLPVIGAGLAARIVEHRERYGPFRRAEHLIMVRGISERRFAELSRHISAQ